MCGENRIKLGSWKLKLSWDDEAGAAVLRICAVEAGARIRTAPVRTAAAVPGGFAVETQDGSAFLLPMEENVWPALYGSEKEEWSRLVRGLPSFELKCFAGMWRDFLCLCEDEAEDRRECEEWAGRNGLEPGDWRRIRDMGMMAAGRCESGPVDRRAPEGNDALCIDLNAFRNNYFSGCSGNGQKDAYLEWGYCSRRVESGKMPLVCLRFKWKDWASPKEAVFYLRYCIRGVNCLEIQEAKLYPSVEARWMSHIDHWEKERSQFHFPLWEHIYLRNVGETPLDLDGTALGPGEMRELETAPDFPQAERGRSERRTL
ncbi:MAG: hypothetical protein KH230_10725 [Enterocloster asparagiformis]|nr:hypothetical protein [Enterocloster asparagiformis]